MKFAKAAQLIGLLQKGWIFIICCSLGWRVGGQHFFLVAWNPLQFPRVYHKEEEIFIS